MCCLSLIVQHSLRVVNFHATILYAASNKITEIISQRVLYSRLFDSQNNNRGGYNVGSLYYYPGSVLPIEWTNQHSCGEANAHCELILQYMCTGQLRDGTKTT